MNDQTGFSRRAALRLAATLGALAAAPAIAAEDDVVTVGDDGLYKQDWFLDSFLDMGDDLKEAAAEGKGLLVVFEQKGCPYCRELHRVNFVHPEISAHIREHYVAVQIDIWGSREATDFDGEAMEERDLAGRWGVSFTPTTILFAPSSAGVGTLAEAETFRMPGYLKPFHYMSALEYVSTGEHEKQPFQRYLQDKFAALAEKGIEPDVW